MKNLYKRRGKRERNGTIYTTIGCVEDLRQVKRSQKIYTREV